MNSVSIYEAKTNLSKLVATVEKGDEVEITRHGRVVARLVPANDGQYLANLRSSLIGSYEGKIRLSPDWEDFTADDDADWYGK